MNYHLLAVNLVTLMVDTSAALWLAALLMLPYCLLFAGSAGAYPPNALVLILPALVVNRLSRMLVNRLPPNIFIFIFVNGFLASAAGILLTGLVLIGILMPQTLFRPKYCGRPPCPSLFCWRGRKPSSAAFQLPFSWH